MQHGLADARPARGIAMKYMATYDLMESIRNTNEWMGATARAMASYPAFALSMNPLLTLTAAWGEVTERSFARMTAKPDWGIRSIVGPKGQDHLVNVENVIDKPFGSLIHFAVSRRPTMARKILVVAPMSGHYARHRLAQCPRHSGQRRQVRYRGLHALSR
jgi:poly(3-hydroxybutyrate) depolymerase